MPSIDGEQLDPKVLKVLGAIRQVESGGDYNAVGDNGSSAGAFQWNNGGQKLSPGQVPANFQRDAQEVGLNGTDFSRANQNKVAYYKIKKLKDEGRQPEEIAAIWNGAKKTPQGTFTYVNPEYGQKFRAALGANNQTAGGIGGSYPAPPPLPTPTSQAPTDTAAPAPSQDNFLVKAAKGVGNFLFPIVGDVYNDIKGTSDKSALQQVGDLGLSALTLIPGAGLAGKGLQAAGLAAKAVKGAETVASAKKAIDVAKLAKQGAAIGYGTDVASKLSQGQTNPIDVLTPGMGTVAGGALGGAGGLLAKGAASVPEKIARHFIPSSNEKVAQYAATKTLGSPTKMLAQSDKDIASLSAQLDKALKPTEGSYVQTTGPELVNKVIGQFPDSELTPEEVVKTLSRLVPLKKGLVTKLASGQDMTLKELHTLNSALGKAVYKTAFDAPALKAGKEVGNATYHIISDAIKQAAPDSAPIFDQLTMEYPLNTALSRAVKSGNRAKTLTLGDIQTFILGTLFHPLGGIPALALEKALRSPTANLSTAQLLKKVPGLIAPTVAGTTPMAARAAQALTNQ